MATITVNSDSSLQEAFGKLRELFTSHKYLQLNIKTGKDRSLPQNSISHAWYQQLGRELREETTLGWRCYCKLHHGVPILRSEDDQYRECYDQVIKPLTYELKLVAMRSWPVTQAMTKDQISQYLEALQKDFLARGVSLVWPEIK